MSTAETLGQQPTLRAPNDVMVRYPLENGYRHSTWIVECGEHTANNLEMPAGTYTLIQLNAGQHQYVKAAERLCALVSHPHVLTVVAVTSSGENDQVWCQAAEAGTLADYCAAKGRLPLEQVSRLAHDLCSAMTYLHENHLSFSQLTGQQVVFTVAGELKLLVPSLDVRDAPGEVLKKHRAEDISALAALLWFCLTGEKAAAQRFRKPLSLSVPEAGETLARTLEDAIDRRSDQPGLQQIAALFELSKDPEPLELHLSAHESVVSRLPAIRPTRFDSVPKERFRRKPPLLGEVQDLSASQATSKKMFSSKKGDRRSPLILGTLTVLAMLVGAGILLTSQESPYSPPESAITEPSNALVQQSLPAQPPEAASKPSTDGGETSLDYAENLSTLIDTRSQVLASGKTGEITRYALAESELHRADTALIAADSDRQLASMTTQLVEINTIEVQGDDITALTIIEAQGYEPKGSEEELETAGIYTAGGRVFQQVNVSARVQDGHLLLVSAVPQTLEE